MKIVLIGYMASGKSAVGKSLSRALQLPFIDLDAYIESKENSTIADLFKNKGEIYFRKAETRFLKELLESNENFVLSLGGGTPCFSGNMDFITKHSVSVYLRASIQTIYDRVIHEKAQRPLVAKINDDDLKEFIAKHLFERASFYEKSGQTIVVDNKSISEISNELLASLE